MEYKKVKVETKLSDNLVDFGTTLFQNAPKKNFIEHLN